jgi:hypothetical protein
MRYYKVEIVNSGAEYNYGTVSDDNQITMIKEAIDNDEVGTTIWSGDDEVSVYNIDMVYNVYGPEIDYATVSITEYSDEDCEDEVTVIMEDIDINETDINCMTSSNPYLTEEMRDKLSDDSLIWGNQRVEKRIHYPAVIALEDTAELITSNIFVSSINTDESIQASEIVDGIFYLTDVEQKHIIKTQMGDEYDEDYTISDISQEIFEENPSLLSDKIADVMDIEGKGEYENDYSLITDRDFNVLYEAGEY